MHGTVEGGMTVCEPDYRLGNLLWSLSLATGYAWLGVLLLIVSNFAYSIGEAFIAAFLPDLGPPQDLGKISGFGWALGGCPRIRS